MPINLYATIDELRDEGWRDPPYKDSLLERNIALASEQIERITGLWFGAKQRTLRVDGTGGKYLPLFVPIVQIDKIEAILDVSGTAQTQVIDPASVRVYNRHLTQGLNSPDDRASPRMEIDLFLAEGFFLRNWPKGSQNIVLSGVFGWTELGPSDSVGETAERSQIPLSQGVIPPQIRYACRLLIRRLLPSLADEGDYDDATRGHLLRSVETRDQEIQWGGSGAGGGVGFTSAGFTGDPRIDQILAIYRRPPEMVMV